MFLRQDQIQHNIAWLLENGSPAVKYLTHCHLLDQTMDGPTTQTLWQAVEQSPLIQEVFSKQQPDGSWCSAMPWAGKPSYIPQGGYSPFTPKYVTTVWVLNILGEMGFRASDPRIAQACEYMLAHQLPNGLFHRFARSSVIPEWGFKSAAELDSAPCELSVYLGCFGRLGMSQDARLTRSYELLIAWQQTDGGWVLQKHLKERFKTRSCPASTHGAAVALYLSDNREYEGALLKALAFLIWHLSLKDERELCRFIFRGHDLLQELLMVADLRIGMEQRPEQVILAWLLSMYDAERGYFHYSDSKSAATDLGPAGAKYGLFHQIEDDWLTYRLTKLAANLID